jgi:YHS domain-containing protein
MTFLARILRFLFWLLVISWGARLLGRIFSSLARNSASVRPEQGANSGGGTETAKVPRRLVRDPVCGMHLDETLAIPMREGDELLHFCSIACRDAYVVSSKKFAAHG